MADVYVGMIGGRHPLPVDKYIFEDELADIKDLSFINLHIGEWLKENVQPHDVLNVYVTGLSMVLASLVSACQYRGIDLVLWHYDQQAADGSYFPQPLFAW